jgi:acyl-CoA reductase-like NAD-dependent aldehyde dehydrogenase
MIIINPATEQPIADIPEDDQASGEKKFQKLKAAQAAFGQMTLPERVGMLQRFSELLEANKTHLAEVLSSEVGKPLQQSLNEIAGARARIGWLTGHATTYLSGETMSVTPGMEEKISYEPLGVVCNISAWNYPYLVGVNVFVPALLAGNTVMYKPSEYATLTGLEIGRLLIESGIPSDAFQVAVGGPLLGAALLDLPFNGYFFTGSYKTGKLIYEKAAAKMVVCQCELGGKDPLYVAEDVADIAGVAAGTADGAFYNNGQSCCAVERIYVHKDKYEDYVQAFVKEVQSWKIGSPTEVGVYLGPLSRPGQVSFLEEQVKDAVDKGAKVMTGGKRIDRAGYYFEPTVLTGVTHDMLVMKEESFGPIIGIMKVNSEAEAVALMKDTEYGLTAAVYSSDKHKAERILAQINTGTGYWNCCDRVSAAVPWSGRGHSGFGATLSHAGLRAFTKPKAYHLRG